MAQRCCTVKGVDIAFIDIEEAAHTCGITIRECLNPNEALKQM